MRSQERLYIEDRFRKITLKSSHGTEKSEWNRKASERFLQSCRGVVMVV